MPGGDVLHRAVVRVGGALAERRHDAEVERQPAQQRQDVVLLGLLPEQLAQLGDLLGVLGGEVAGLGEVVGQVVQLRRVGVGVPDAGREVLHRRRGGVPRDARQHPRRPASRPCTSRGCRRSRSTAGCGARARRRRRSCRGSWCRGSASARCRRCSSGAGMPAASRIVGPMSMTCVNWLRSPPVSAMRARPAHDHRVARAAEVRGDLLAPLERGVARPRPGRRVVRRHDLRAPGLEAAVLLDQRELLLAAQHDPVLHRQLVERARSALPSRLAPLSPGM